MRFADQKDNTQRISCFCMIDSDRYLGGGKRDYKFSYLERWRQAIRQYDLYASLVRLCRAPWRFLCLWKNGFLDFYESNRKFLRQSVSNRHSPLGTFSCLLHFLTAPPNGLFGPRNSSSLVLKASRLAQFQQRAKTFLALRFIWKGGKNNEKAFRQKPETIGQH